LEQRFLEPAVEVLGAAVELWFLLGDDHEVLPALAEELQDLVHLAGIGLVQADGLGEDVLAEPDVRAVPASLQVNRPNEVKLMEFVGRAGLAGRAIPGGDRSGASRTLGEIKPLLCSRRSMGAGWKASGHREPGVW
jgi:hypothetical protein